MAQRSVIPEVMPGQYKSVDCNIWADHALMMLQNRDWNTRAYYFVGVDEKLLHQASKAFYWVMKQQGLEFVEHKRSAVRQRMSAKGIQQLGNVSIFGGYHPNTFFELVEGSFAIPLGDSLEAIEKCYDAGFPIWIVQLKVKD